MTKRRVLIVEDEPFIALEIAAIVNETIDAELLLSNSVARATELMDHSVDLALLDVNVTDGETFEVAQLLRARRIPFIFLSGARGDEIPRDLRDVPFVRKPWNEQELILLIHKALPDEQRLFPRGR